MSDAVEPMAGAVVPAEPRNLTPLPGVAAPAPPADTPPAPVDDSVMSLTDHLTELRRRLVICIVAIIAGGLVGFYFADEIITLMADPLPANANGGPKLIFLTLSGSFLNYMKVSLVVGIIIALPVIIYQLWQFVAPGLTQHERKAALPWIPAAISFFLLGTIVAYVTLPYAVQFLTAWNIPGVTQTVPSGENYYGFVTLIFLLFGSVMEFPIVLVLLAKLGILTVDRLKSSRRVVLLGVVVFAVVATPGGDPISPLVMAGTMYALYELTIWVLARGERREEASA